ncbi:RNA polymerase sigma-70 factor [Sphingobacterium corticibacterium]|uniref:RNA polymerase sigma-70 factor n=1 Tax=Sphingobacterium corticibacterium TaxID=2484746 RepID=A0A4Q6Y131_9SPHI|nr:RNA polymerase sigma-70 factor [Sphingobacterium corticibacterium]RZF62696.1 RNA polymerase sigma-70 factor [Sphingobacterium corticibacterium]
MDNTNNIDCDKSNILNESTFKALYDAHWLRLFRYALSHTKDQAVAEEIVQQIFESLWSRRSALQIDHCTISNFLTRAVKLKIFDHHRHLAIQRQAQPILLETAEQSANTTEDTCQFNELSTQVSILVSQLPERCREVYRLNIEEGMTYKAVASRMGISPHTVKEHLARARHYIRENLQRNYNDPILF